MTGGDTQVREEQRDECAAHGRTAVRVNGELVRRDALLRAGRRQQALGQVRIMGRCETIALGPHVGPGAGQRASADTRGPEDVGRLPPAVWWWVLHIG